MRSDVVEADGGRGIYRVCGKFWNVGSRYKLHEHIGAGSYGDVCRATDCEENFTVALKRVADVLCCPLLAKRVLREVCIMRRLSHPYVITLTNVFASPSIDVNGGLDLYIATEFADGGDLYHLSIPLSPQEVKFLMWQLLTGLSYVHSCRVWHRDIKSENILLNSDMSVKICDFGLSRSAEEAVGAELQNGSVNNAPSVRKSLQRQYTKMVVTPSYRAPEVIMSRGQYSSAIDIWSLGCIFWELLVRSLDPSMTGPPGRPLFGVREEPVTPPKGQNYTADEFSPLHDQLDVIFDVIGTPGWTDIESVPSDSWRSYLMRLPGRAGNLMAQLIGRVDQQALDLILRMLAFNPSRRCTAEEALSHLYFKGLERPTGFMNSSFEQAAPGEYIWKIKDPAIALDFLERELESSVYERDGGRQKLEWLLQQEIEQQQQQNLFRKSVLQSLQLFRMNAMLINRPALTNFASDFDAQQQQQQHEEHQAQHGFFPNATAVAALVTGMKAKAAIHKQQHQQQAMPVDSINNNINIDANRDKHLPAARVTRSSAAESSSFVELPNRSTRSSKKEATPKASAKEEEQQQTVRRSPRLKDLQASGVPHRKRLCLKAG